jgi:hypothetical protein
MSYFFFFGGGKKKKVSGYDADAQKYITAVETADGQALETGVKVAINTFVVGCKADGTWSAIKASCIMAGARTLSGALVPLVGTAPTNINFVSGDYDRKSGLVGNGSSKYLDTNRGNAEDPQDNNHNSVYVSTISSIPGGLISTDTGGAVGSNNIYTSGTSGLIRCRTLTSTTVASVGTTAGFKGTRRSAAASYTIRSNSTNTVASTASDGVVTGTLKVFRRTTINYANARIAFYSIGESLDLALLDTRVTRLLTEIAFSVNTGLDGSAYDIDTLRYVNAGYAAGGTLA